MSRLFYSPTILRVYAGRLTGKWVPLTAFSVADMPTRSTFEGARMNERYWILSFKIVGVEGTGREPLMDNVCPSLSSVQKVGHTIILNFIQPTRRSRPPLLHYLTFQGSVCCSFWRGNLSVKYSSDDTRGSEVLRCVRRVGVDKVHMSGHRGSSQVPPLTL